MADRNAILALAQLMVAAAWADGELDNEEINRLKALLRQLPRTSAVQDVEIHSRDWAEVEIFLDTPPTPEERAQIIERLRLALNTSIDRTQALAALEDLIQADGTVSPEEQALLNEVRAALETSSPDVGIFARLGMLLRRPLQRPAPVAPPAAPRSTVDDYVANRVYYLLNKRPDLNPAQLGISDAELRRLCLAGALLARVSRADEAVSEAESGVLAVALQRGWGIDAGAAGIVAEVASSPGAAEIDFVKVTNDFLNVTSPEDRERFLTALFSIAAADGTIAPRELDEIRHIGQGIKLTTNEINNARDRAARRLAEQEQG